MDRNNIEKIAHTPEDRLLLAQVWDKIQIGMRRDILAATCFLSARELEMTRYLFGQAEGLVAEGGYPDAERKMLLYIPSYSDIEQTLAYDSPLACIRAQWHESEQLSHRDLLGALLGLGIARQTVGDICVGEGRADFFVTAQIAPHVLQSLSSAGRARLQVCQIPLQEAQIPEAKTQTIKDTVASVRLDSVISAGFRIARGPAAQHICAGRAAIDGLPCEKPDKPVCQGAKISVRGLGKLRLRTVGATTKKGRISIEIDRYI